MSVSEMSINPEEAQLDNEQCEMMLDTSNGESSSDSLPGILEEQAELANQEAPEPKIKRKRLRRKKNKEKTLSDDSTGNTGSLGVSGTSNSSNIPFIPTLTEVEIENEDSFGEAPKEYVHQAVSSSRSPLESTSLGMRESLDEIANNMISEKMFPEDFPVSEGPFVFTFTPDDFQAHTMTTWSALDYVDSSRLSKRMLFFTICQAIYQPILDQLLYNSKRQEAVSNTLSKAYKKLQRSTDDDQISNLELFIERLQSGEYIETIDSDPKINPRGFTPGQSLGAFTDRHDREFPNFTVLLEQIVSKNNEDLVCGVRLWIFSHNKDLKLGKLVQRVIETNRVTLSEKRKKTSNVSALNGRIIENRRTPKCNEEIDSLEAWCTRILAPIFGGREISTLLDTKMKDINNMGLEEQMNPANPIHWFSIRNAFEREFKGVKILEKQLDAKNYFDADEGVYKMAMPEYFVILEPSQLEINNISRSPVVRFNPMMNALLTTKVCSNSLSDNQKSLMGIDFDKNPERKRELLEFARQLVKSRPNPMGEVIAIPDNSTYEQISQEVRRALGKSESRLVVPTNGEVNGIVASNSLKDAPLQYLHIFAKRNRLMQYTLKCTPKRVALTQSAKQFRHLYEKFKTDITRCILNDEDLSGYCTRLRDINEDIEELNLAKSLYERKPSRELKEKLENFQDDLKKLNDERAYLIGEVLKPNIKSLSFKIQEGLIEDIGNNEMRSSELDLSPDLVDILDSVCSKSTAFKDLDRACENKIKYQEEMCEEIWKEMLASPKDAPEGSGLEATERCPWSCPSVRGVQWYSNLDTVDRWMIINRLSKNLSPYGEMRVMKNITFTKFLRLMPGTPSYDVWKMQLVRHTAGQACFDLKPNLLFVGPAAVGKSFRLKKTEEVSFPGSVLRPSHVTQNASNVDGDPKRDCLTAIEETPPYMLGMENTGKVLPGGSETVKQSLASGFTVTHSIFCSPDGLRLPTLHVSNTNGASICLSNLKNPPRDNPTVNRYIVEHVLKETKDRRYQVRDIAIEKVSEINEDERCQFLLCEKLHHWYSYLCEKFIEGGAIEDVRTDEAIDLMRLIIDELETKHSIPKMQVRYFNMFGSLIRAATIMGAVWTELFTEQAFERHWWDTKNDCPKEFDPKIYARRISPRLHAGVEQVVDVLTLYAPAFMPNCMFEILVCCRKLWKKNEGKYTFRKRIKVNDQEVRTTEPDQRYIAFIGSTFDQIFQGFSRETGNRISTDTIKGELEQLQADKCVHIEYDEIYGHEISRSEIECVIQEHNPEDGKPQICIAVTMLEKSSDELSRINGALKSAIKDVVSHRYAQPLDVVINTPLVADLRDKDEEIFYRVLDVIKVRPNITKQLCIRNPLAVSVTDKLATGAFSSYATWKNNIELHRQLQSSDFLNNGSNLSPGQILKKMDQSGIISQGISLAQEAPVLYVNGDFDQQGNTMRLLDIEYPGILTKNHLEFDHKQDIERCLKSRNHPILKNVFLKQTGLIPEYPTFAALPEALRWDMEDDQREVSKITEENKEFMAQTFDGLDVPTSLRAQRSIDLRSVGNYQKVQEMIRKSKSAFPEKLSRSHAQKRQFSSDVASIQSDKADDYLVSVRGNRIVNTKKNSLRDVSAFIPNKNDQYSEYFSLTSGFQQHYQDSQKEYLRRIQKRNLDIQTMIRVQRFAEGDDKGKEPMETTPIDYPQIYNTKAHQSKNTYSSRSGKNPKSRNYRKRNKKKSKRRIKDIKKDDTDQESSSIESLAFGEDLIGEDDIVSE